MIWHWTPGHFRLFAPVFTEPHEVAHVFRAGSRWRARIGKRQIQRRTWAAACEAVERVITHRDGRMRRGPAQLGMPL